MSSAFEPTSPCFMPLLLGPVNYCAQHHYRRREVIAVQYTSTLEAIAAVLPECFRPAGPPIVTFAFAYNDGVDFMAGRGYRLGTVLVGARFDGEHDHVQGNYPLVMFEDDTLAIITGREITGIPKLYADFSPIRRLPDGRLRCELSFWGHFLFAIEVDGLNEQEPSVAAAANRQPQLPYLGYKLIPSLEGPPDVAYPVVYPIDVTIRELWLGTAGRVYFGDAGEEDISYVSRVVQALRRLPLQQFVGASHSVGSSILRTDLARRLL